MPERFIVITGGPGAGKTTLIEALAAQGYATAPEAGRGIIQDQMAIDGQALPWRDKALFAEMMLAADLATYRKQPVDAEGPVFFDRGIPDIAGYLTLSGLAVPAHVERAIRLCRYNCTVFICPPWPEIYAGDTERKQSLGEAARTSEAMRVTYSRYGYRLTEVPRLTVAERVAFILAAVGSD
ncbi:MULTISPECIES: AAA family ATPase [unclassified Chelatococcus]|uniref:AAA family ATPase n=1 Tax=unclassified Chelatococcus TaxID=2638111 RepID=UPI0020C09FB8|nr:MULTISPECIES: AAA family ATPase [unclassified Chelatococcus]MCO5077970.1 AAA family ATPase [Chelatococcus sp.]CAH1660677.1 putative ATPase [Hyphomicrobiales bacterium]CAH1683340.1 putative ATPase [Hyphomicrobiales bacterium]